MDIRDPKVQKYLLGGLVVFLVLYFWYARVYTKNAADIKQKQVQYEYLLSDLKRVEMKSKTFASLKEEYEKLLERYKKVECLLPEEKQIPLLLTQMHSAASNNETGVLELIPQDPAAAGFYNVNSFDIGVNGSYHDLGSFFSSIANFPFLANVSDVTITALPYDEQLPELKGKSIAASLKLTTYYVKEEEKLQRVEF
jgi:type IV pilus assembly protein PilO